MTSDALSIAENGLTESNCNGNGLPVTAKYSCWLRLYKGPDPSSTRYIYGVIFFVTNLLAWAIRDYGQSAISGLKKLEGCHGARECLGAEGVFRISLGCFAFFLVMLLSTARTNKLADARSLWHINCWALKLILWVGLMVIPFLLPSAIIHFYGEIAHLGAGIFLLIQLISVISFITWLNDRCRSEKNAERCRVRLLVASFSAHASCLMGIIMMYVWYAPKLSDLPNVIFISLTLGLLQIMTFISILPMVNVGFLAPGLMGVYMVFLCWCAIRSEPQGENREDWLTIASFIIAVVAIVMATFSTGVDSKTFQFKKGEAEPDDVPYDYGFFHFVFAMGAMYFAMLFTNWNANHTVERWRIDVGWVSTWVRVVNEWLAAILYVWMLISHAVRKRGSGST
ncbi:uncharacterized protein LOC144703859 [Wolffia australiana]